MEPYREGRKECHSMSEAEIAVMVAGQRLPRLAGHHQKLGRNRKNSFQEPSEKAWQYQVNT